MDLRKQVFSGFRPLRKKQAAVREPTIVISAKRTATREGSSLERTMTKGNTHCHEVPPSRPHLPNSLPAGDSDVAGTSTPLSRRRGKEALHIMATLGEIRYESQDLEAQLQLQLMSFIEATNKVEELKKRLEDVEMEFGTF
ncbi:hypothetical protein F0562_031694 [Nyssa sinensis]|uniref:Uncharacterized protein n=1 Tax=Nyssa sinensis TaxID=561372 RepID=A0A5J5AT48_9ASTE|nr:hypothetical protein F0562_031694 [Nyssa sinensis]